MYNTLTGGKIEMLPFDGFCPFEKEKKEGGQ